MSRATHPPKLRDRVRQVIRIRRYSRRTEKSYWYWIRSFIRFHGMRHPSELGAEDVCAFLTWLAVRRDVAASTQNQALNALVFLYDKVLEQPLGNIGSAVRAKRPPRLPVVLEHVEAMAIITALKMPYRLMVSLMYGAGLRVAEATRLRVKDVDVSRQILIVRNGKGGKDRTTLLPQALRSAPQERTATIRNSVPCKNFSATGTCARHRSIRTCSVRGSPVSEVHWVERTVAARIPCHHPNSNST